LEVETIYFGQHFFLPVLNIGTDQVRNIWKYFGRKFTQQNGYYIGTQQRPIRRSSSTPYEFPFPSNNMFATMPPNDKGLWLLFVLVKFLRITK